MIYQFCITLHGARTILHAVVSRAARCSSIGDLRGIFTAMTKRVTTFTRANDLSPIVQPRRQRPFTKRVVAFSRNARARLGPVREQRELRLTSRPLPRKRRHPLYTHTRNNICGARVEGGPRRGKAKRGEERDEEILTSGHGDLRPRSRGSRALGRFCKTKCLVSKSVTARTRIHKHAT